MGRWIPITGKKDPSTRCAPSTWKVQPTVTDMSNLFGASICDGAEWGKLTNGVSHDDMGAWDVSGVTNMERLFGLAAEFNLPLSSWNVAKVTKMPQMFKDAVKFNQPLNSWNVAKLTKTNNMFENAEAFNQGLGAWDVGTNNFANVAGFSADYGLLSTYQITDMFKGTTAMSDCNKKAIHNKFEAAPRSLNAWKVQRGIANADNAF